MNLFIDAETGSFYSNASLSRYLSSINLTRGDIEPLKITFVDSATGAVTPLPSDFVVTATLNPKAIFSYQYAAVTGTSTSTPTVLSGSGSTSLYTLLLNLQGSYITSDFTAQAPSGFAEAATIPAALQVAWSSASSGLAETSATLPVTLYNVQNRSGLPGIIISNAGLLFSSTIAGLTGNTSSSGLPTSLDAIATVGLSTGTVVLFNLPSVGLVAYQLQAGTTAATASGVIHGNDYNAVSNQKIWIKIL